MMKNKKISLSKLANFFSNNLSIVVILAILLSIMSIMMINGFRVEYESLDTAPETAILVEDRVPALAAYYQRDRIPVTIVLEQSDGENLNVIEYEARWNSNRIFSEAFIDNLSKLPEKEGYLFTHFSLLPDGEPLDPGIRVTEPMTVYANWITTPKVQPWQTLAQVNNQIELARQRYVPYYYSYFPVNKGANQTVTLDEIDGLTRKDGYEVTLRISGTESKPIVNFSFNYDRINRYTVNMDLNGGKLQVSTQPTTYLIPENGSINESPNVTKEGHRFLGWSTSIDGNVVALEDIVLTSDDTLYAIYQPSQSVPVPGSTQGRYLTSYMIESVDYTKPLVVLMVTDNTAEIDSIIEAEEIVLDNFEKVILGESSKKQIVFAGQFSIVSKKDKIASLNNKVMSYTETNIFGIIALALLAGVLFWAFLDNSSRNIKFLGWAILLTIAAVLIFMLPSLVNFSAYFQNIWDTSLEINPEATKIVMLPGMLMAGLFITFGAFISYITYFLTIINRRKQPKQEEISE